MATSRELKNKIRTISNTKKITRTMEMVATAKSRVCQKRIEAVRPYGDRLLRVLRDLRRAAASGGAGEAGHPLLRSPEKTRREALFVVSANRGLCGGYNTNVLRRAEHYLERCAAEGIEVEVHMIGKKGASRFRYLGRPVAQTYTQFQDQPEFEETVAVSGPIIERFAAGELDSVQLIFTHYESAGRQHPVVQRMLPIAVAADEAQGEQAAGAHHRAVDFIFEPSPRFILAKLLPLSLKTQFFQALVEAAACEQIARRIAMKNATDNADEMVRTYTQRYNRTRQAGITQEILEVIGGSEGQS